MEDVGYNNELEDPTDEENDMLGLVFGLTETTCIVLFYHCTSETRSDSQM